MPCDLVSMPNGGSAIVCTSRRQQRCACGRVATLVCDWRTPTRTGTCDTPICGRCTTSPARGKDLCPDHARAFEAWKARRAASSGGAPVAAPLPDIDASAVAPADVSAPKGRSSKPALAAAQPETVNP